MSLPPDSLAAGAEVAQNRGPNLRIMHSRNLPQWLAEQRLSLAFTTYHTSRLFFVGLDGRGRVAFHAASFPRAMGLWVSPDTQTLYLSTLAQLVRLANNADASPEPGAPDRFYVPRVCYTTGDLDIHDVSCDSGGRPVFVNSLHSCLATVSETQSFVPLWKPPFISRLAAEDRCHLNGLAMENGAPKYVTCVAQTDANDGWRDHRRSGGVVLDVASGEPVVRGLSMPHSPRIHQGKLWVLDSGNGYLGYVDTAAGRFERVTFCAGYPRGLAFMGGYAVVAISLSRHNVNFSGLALDEELAKRNVQARCGIQVIDLKSGDIVHGVRIDGAIRELYEVSVLPGVRQADTAGFDRRDIPKLLSFRA
ncbi:MAG TPA: TIGR03032 family protein [Methylococcaceae bacterium]|nr:TIGR03032 family protein [Methylococcaceae bacterium]